MGGNNGRGRPQVEAQIQATVAVMAQMKVFGMALGQSIEGFIAQACQQVYSAVVRRGVESLFEGKL